MSARVHLLRPLPRLGHYNAPVVVDMTREQWLSAQRDLGADAVLLDYVAPPDVVEIIDALTSDGDTLPAAAVVEPQPKARRRKV
jgi:hypothetical protein